MRLARGLQCPICGRECTAWVQVTHTDANDKQGMANAACSEHCLNIYIKHRTDSQTKFMMNLDCGQLEAPLVSLHECASRLHAEMIFLFNLIRSLCHLETLRLIL